jgi:excisionase family DNA binding protein
MNQVAVKAVPKLLLTMEEAADALGICRALLYQLVMRGQIPSIKIGRSRRVPVSALHAYIAHLMEEK